jgi:hypothetical protein
MYDNKSRIYMEEAAFKRRRLFFTRKLDLNLSKKLVMYHTWSIALFGTESWMLWKNRYVNT